MSNYFFPSLGEEIRKIKKEQEKSARAYHKLVETEIKQDIVTVCWGMSTNFSI